MRRSDLAPVVRSVMQNVGLRIAELREAKGWRQADLAIAIKTKPEQDVQSLVDRVSRLERGVGNPTIETLIGIAEALDRKVLDLFETPVDSRPRQPGRPRKPAT